jgi:hypothetical protein
MKLTSNYDLICKLLDVSMVFLSLLSRSILKTLIREGQSSNPYLLGRAQEVMEETRIALHVTGDCEWCAQKLLERHAKLLSDIIEAKARLEADKILWPVEPNKRPP